MKTNEIKLTSQGLGMKEALEATEKLGAEAGLGHKELLRLRLLGEELCGLMRGITGDLEASYFAEQENKTFNLHLTSDVTLNLAMRRQLIDVSSTGENAAAKGFTGKLREMIAVALLPRGTGPSLLSMGFMSMGSPGGFRASTGTCDWSLLKYKEEVGNNRAASGEADAAWDELEKSIVAQLADEITVSVVGSRVEITIRKAF